MTNLPLNFYLNEKFLVSVHSLNCDKLKNKEILVTLFFK
jgi:hypothetical protein